MSKRKYEPGEAIISLDDLIYYLNTRDFVYIRGKILHKGWVMSLQFRYLVSTMAQGYIKSAIKLKGN